MNRPIAVLLLALLPGLALAQIAAPPSPTATRSTTTVAPAPVATPPPGSAPAPVQGPLPSPVLPRQPIPSSGPAKPVAPPARTLPDKVYDRDGRIVPGMKAVGPNRVLDTNTGRYYDSIPQGNGQQIK
ncbi:classical arabinogalactan protein 4 [Stenotrophomonas sp. 24(2023)]|uniref:classical arabinogalactan protein 4 n=1 Tax=Stenotrophomonas sp. 24(2023) TaxID=3068324 RepID=UPI0027DEE630|nr:classical arabinogalactan protein 4 [Stenotrophomonas sp. 24(2023)]WMJ67684.1 classical arabinogalactan protein 4 [Stenotrophomonas sp. 24(2023)]